jgi:glycine cleavage system aminomethyltransferase T/glycine/D-amino acid oxidase-like deaminating enzyme
VRELRDRARVVVIGAGIAGNSLAYHLAKLGWRDIVLVDKGPLPNPGGSTGHASNMMFLNEASADLTALTAESVRQYRELGVFTQSGGIEVARTPERIEEFKRRLGLSRSLRYEAELITPARVKELVPYIDASIILGGLCIPESGVVDAVLAATLMREKALEMGAVSIAPLTEVTGIGVVDGRVAAVRTTRGTIQTETVVIACGIWSPRIARMAGASIPLTPAVHQLIRFGPVSMFAETHGEIEFPMVRDMDAKMYERQHWEDLEVGSTAHRPILVSPDEIPSIEESAMSPTELPFTSDDFHPQMGHALQLMPGIFGDEHAGLRYATNGLLSLTADGLPILGETPEVRGLWSANLVWTKTGPGIARMLAEWMTDGQTGIDSQPFDIARFHDHERTEGHVRFRTAEWFNKFYGIVHPAEQSESNRDVRLSPMNARERELGAVFLESAGWETPNWYQSNERLLAEYGERVMPRGAEWESRWWSPIINAEHLAMRDRVGMVDLSALAIFDVTGPGALDYLQSLTVSQIDVEPGRVVHTWLLNPAGRVLSDLTIVRLGRDQFRLMEGGPRGMLDKKWFVDHLRADGSAQLSELTSALCTVGVWGPCARDLVQSIARADLSNEAFPFLTARAVDLGSVRTLMSRISYVGELGWEIYAPMEQGQRLWDTLWEAGQAHGVVPVGSGVISTTGRLEKGYRAQGAEFALDFDLVEAGLARPKVKDADFVGKAAYLEQRSRLPAAILCTLTVDDPMSKSGIKRYMMGREPILSADGDTLVDAKGRRSYVTSAGSGPSLGKHLLMAYLPAEAGVESHRLLVEYFGELYPVTVAAAGSTPLFDPKFERIRS